MNDFPPYRNLFPTMKSLPANGGRQAKDDEEE